MFTGFIHYKNPEEQFTSIGYDHIFDPANEKKLRVRESALKDYSLDYWKELLENGITREEGIDIYYSSEFIHNKIYIMMCGIAIILMSIMCLISFYRIDRL